MPVNKLLALPYGSYLMVRLDYVIICGNELEAKILRIIEQYMEDERKMLYRDLLNDPQGGIDPNAEIEITKDVWPAISHRLFKNDLYDQDMSENTLKRAIKSLKKKKFIRVRSTDLKRYEAPKYQINTEVVQEQLTLLGKLGKSEYQKLMVSKIDGIKNSSHQNMTLSGGQKLIPSRDSMGSKIDGNSRKITLVESTEESILPERESTSPVGAFAPPLSDSSLLGDSSLEEITTPTNDETPLPVPEEHVPATPPVQEVPPQQTPPDPEPPIEAEQPPQQQALMAPTPAQSRARQAPKWNAAAMVEAAERLRKKAFTSVGRPKEVKAAEKIIKRRGADATLEEFERVFTHRNDDWWIEHNGPLTLVKLAAIPKNDSDMRYMLELEKIEREAERKKMSPTKPAGKPAQPAPTQEENPYTVEAHLKRNPNQLDKYFKIYEQMQAQGGAL